MMRHSWVPIVAGCLAALLAGGLLVLSVLLDVPVSGTAERWQGVAQAQAITPTAGPPPADVEPGGRIVPSEGLTLTEPVPWTPESIEGSEVAATADAAGVPVVVDVRTLQPPRIQTVQEEVPAGGTATPVILLGGAVDATPTPGPSIAVTVTAPAEPLPAGSTVPLVVWLDDQPERGQTKVMGWHESQSFPINVGKSNVVRMIGQLDVSPGGEWIAFTTVDNPAIQQVSTTSGALREIKPAEAGRRFTLPRWSPDGSRLSFLAEEQLWPGALPANIGIWISGADGSDLHQAVPGRGAFTQPVSFADWHPSGTDLIYASGGRFGPAMPQWYAVPAAGGSSQTLPLAGSLYGLAPDGSWLLGEGYTNQAPTGREKLSFRVLMRIPVDGTSPKVLTPGCRSDVEGRISPDGSRIAVLSIASIAPSCPRVSGAVQHELWLMNTDGTDRRKLNADGVFGVASPQWSSDGEYLVYSLQGDKGLELWRTHASGSIEAERLEGTLGVNRFRTVQ